MNTSTPAAMLLGSFMALLASKSVLTHDFESHPPAVSQDSAPLAPVPTVEDRRSEFSSSS